MKNGKWIVSVQDEHGEWWPLKGEYDTPAPEDGGTPEMVIEEERKAAKPEGIVYEDGTIRADWKEED